MQLRRLLISAASLALTLAALELGFRLLAPHLGVDRRELKSIEDLAVRGRSPLYEPHAYVGYRMRAGQRSVGALGFAGPEAPPGTAPGTVRIACLGGSETQGSRPWRAEEFLAVQLREALAAAGAGPVEVQNRGVPGWTTAETLAAYFTTVQDHAPDVVVYQHALGDVAPRLWPGLLRDYSHYRRPWRQRLCGPLEELAVEKSELYAWLYSRRRGSWGLGALVDRPPAGPLALEGGTDSFRRNVLTVGEHVAARGGAVALVTTPLSPRAEHGAGELPAACREGVEQHNEALRELARAEGWLLVDAAAWFAERPERVGPLFRNLVFLEAGGTRLVAERVTAALQGAGLLGP